MATLTNQEFVSKKDLYIFKVIDSRFHVEYILALLNSTLFSFLKIKSSTAAKKDDFTQLTLSDIRELPIKLINHNEQIEYKNLVTQILTAKATDPAADTSALEAEIDRLVYALYGLTDEEIAIVEG